MPLLPPIKEAVNHTCLGKIKTLNWVHTLVQQLFKRNLNGIGRTILEFEDNEIEVEPPVAERSLSLLQGNGDVEYEYFFSTFARKEIGSIEGRIVDLSTDYDEPSIKLREHRTGREIQCRVSDVARQEIEDSLTAGDVWTHRRVRVRGTINYDQNGKIVRVYDGKISYIGSKRVSLKDIADPDFTGGLPAYEYIDRLREGQLG